MRFVILRHEYDGVHFDLMLECDAKLRTWRLAAPPAAGESQLAEAAFDHRLIYLDYEGPVSGGRGTVTRWDWGTYAGNADDADAIAVKLYGKRLGCILKGTKQTGGLWVMQFDDAD